MVEEVGRVEVVLRALAVQYGVESYADGWVWEIFSGPGSMLTRLPRTV